MSSPMMTRMFGFGCWADAGAAAIVAAASVASRPRWMLLMMLMVESPDSGCPNRARFRRSRSNNALDVRARDLRIGIAGATLPLGPIVRAVCDLWARKYCPKGQYEPPPQECEYQLGEAARRGASTLACTGNSRRRPELVEPSP